MATNFGKRKDGRVYPKGSVGDPSKGMSRATFDKLRRQDARRPSNARAVDNKIRAPIDFEGKHWQQEPNRYDVRGIDDPRTRRPDPFEKLNESFRKSKYFKLVE